MGLLLFFFCISITFSFLCSVWEAVLLSITPTYVSQQQQAGTSLGRDLAIFKQDVDRPLSAILTLNTIAHTVGAIGVGAQAGKVFGSTELNLWVTTISYESVIAAAMTLAILVLSEIIPKTIGANLWRTLAPFTVRSLRVLLVVLAPFVWMSQGITRTLKREKGRSVFSRADFAVMAQAGEESGALAETESRIIKNLLRFESIQAKDIMTPRTVMLSADETMSLAEFHEKHQPLLFSRIPVFHETPDEITGFVLKDELLEALLRDAGQQPLSSLRKKIQAVPSSKPLPALFDALTTSRTHIAIVVDEFGSVDGLVTIEDVVETLLGVEIVDETDAVVDLQQLARERWKVRAKRVGLIGAEKG